MFYFRSPAVVLPIPFSANLYIAHFKGFIIANFFSVQEKVFFYLPNLFYSKLSSIQLQF